MKMIARRALDALMHTYGSVSKRYYAEDFVRVYPDGIRVTVSAARSQRLRTTPRIFSTTKRFTSSPPSSRKTKRWRISGAEAAMAASF